MHKKGIYQTVIYTGKLVFSRPRRCELNKHMINKVPRCGAMDSKYFGQQEQLEKDVAAHKFKDELFKVRLKQLMLESPAEIDKRYQLTIEVFTEMKEQYGL